MRACSHRTRRQRSSLSGQNGSRSHNRDSGGIERQSSLAEMKNRAERSARRRRLVTRTNPPSPMSGAERPGPAGPERYAQRPPAAPFLMSPPPFCRSPSIC